MSRLATSMRWRRNILADDLCTFPVTAKVEDGDRERRSRKYYTRYGGTRMNKAAVGLMLLMVGAAAFLDAQSAERSTIWTSLGPAGLLHVTTNGRTVVSGRVDIAVSDPRDANVLYVGTNVGGGTVLGGGGCWKTTNSLP